VVELIGVAETGVLDDAMDVEVMDLTPITAMLVITMVVIT